MNQMTQDEINSTEWQNPDNWGEPKNFGIYFSKNDSRIIVPKRNPKMGWTINFAQRSALFWLFGCFALFFILGSVLGGSFTYFFMEALNLA